MEQKCIAVVENKGGEEKKRKEKEKVKENANKQPPMKCQVNRMGGFDI